MTRVDSKARWLVAQLNYKLAAKHQVITRTQGKRRTQAAYQLLDIRTGQLSYLNLRDVEALAKRLGAIREPLNHG